MSEPGLRLVYAFDNRVPSAQADTEQLASNVAALSRRGIDVVLLIPRLGDEVDGAAIRDFYHVEGAFRVAYYAPLRRPRVGQKLWAALRVARSSEARSSDLLYTRNLPIALAGVLMGRRVVFESYRPWPDQYPLLRPVVRKLMRSDNFVGGIFHSELARSSHERAGAPANRLLVGYNGYEPSRMHPVLDRRQARFRLGLPIDRNIVVYAGRIAADRGLDVVLRTAERCREVLFVLVGARGQDSFEQEASAIDNVMLAPWQPYDRISDWLYAADVLVIPPSSAPLEQHGNTVLPMKLFSYLAAGRPILAPASPDVQELLIDGENALLVRPGDDAGAAERLARALNDGDLWKRVAAGAHQLASGLTWDARAGRIHDFLTRRLDEMGSGPTRSRDPDTTR